MRIRATRDPASSKALVSRFAGNGVLPRGVSWPLWDNGPLCQRWIEWCEERILESHLPERPGHLALPLGEMELLAGLAPDALAALEGRIRIIRAGDGERVFRAGDPGDSLYLVRLGRVRLVVPGERGRELMLGVFGRGDVVGELAFIDGRRRSADALACADTELYQLTRAAFEDAAREVPALREALPARLNRVLTFRLRVTTQQLRAAEE